MATAERTTKDPYDEAENKVRKNIRKLIVLQSQVMEELRSMPSEARIESTSKGTELLSICSGIENDINELQKVIDAIKAKPEKYNIAVRVLATRQATIDEFRSKIRGVHQRNVASNHHPTSSSHSSLGTSFAQHQLQTQKEMLQQQDLQLNVLNSSASNLHENAVAINVEVTNQNRILLDVNEDLDETQFRLHSLGKQMAIFLDTNNPSLLKLVIILCGIAVLLFMVIILF